MMGTRELQLLREAPHGIFTRDDALAAGYSARTIQRRTASGLWVPLCPDVLVPAGTPVTTQLIENAAIRWLGPEVARLSHSSAARRHGWDVPDDGTAWSACRGTSDLPASIASKFTAPGIRRARCCAAG